MKLGIILFCLFAAGMSILIMDAWAALALTVMHGHRVIALMLTVSIALPICVFQMFWSKIKQRRLGRKIDRLNNDLYRPESLLEEKED